MSAEAAEQFKLKGPKDLPERLRDSGLVELPITIEHSIAAGRLPRLHSDPFDRMLIAQTLCEDLTLVTPSSPGTRTSSGTSFLRSRSDGDTRRDPTFYLGRDDG